MNQSVFPLEFKAAGRAHSARRLLLFCLLIFPVDFPPQVDRILPNYYNNSGQKAAVSAVCRQSERRTYMRKKELKGIFSAAAAALLSFGMVIGLPGFSGVAFPAQAEYFGSISAYAAGAATVKASTLNVRGGAGTGHQRLGELTRGASVTVLEELRGEDGKDWVKIGFQGGEGYVQRSYLRMAVSYTRDEAFESSLSAEGFPETYKERLREIHAQYPNWVFRADNTGLSWEEVISNEGVVGRNLVYTGSKSSWKSTAAGAFDWAGNYWPGFDSSAWVAASEGVLRYYMDPRNFLDSSYVFQFLTQSYDAGTQTAGGVETLAKGTFIEGRYSGSSQTDGSEGVSGPGAEQSSSGAETGSTENGGAAAAQSAVGVTAAAPGEDAAAGNAEAAQMAASPQSAEAAQTAISPQSTEAAQTAGGIKTAQMAVGAAPAENAGSAESANAAEVTGVLSGAPQNRYNDSAKQYSEEKTTEARTSQEAAAAFSYALPETDKNFSLHVTANAVVGRGSRSVNVTDPVVGGSSTSTSEGATSGNSASGSGPAADYIDIIMEAAAQSGVNPYVLASMIIQEQGSKGSSGLISGKNATYPGIYNFFNVQAYSDGSMSATTRGLWWASQSGSYGRPWDSIRKAIVGGAQYYGENFIRSGQDTFYLKKFNVTSKNRYQHQYMTNVEGAASEGFKLGEAYNAELKKTALVFRIPVYSGMPDTPAELPSGDGNPNNKLSMLSAEGFSLTPSFSMDTFTYDLIVDPSVNAVTLQAKTIDSGASVEGSGRVELSGEQTAASVKVRAANGDLREYVITISKRNGGQRGGAAEAVQQSGDTSGPGGDASAAEGSVQSDNADSGDQTALDGVSVGSGNVSLVAPSGN